MNDSIRPINDLEWLILEPHVTRWQEAQQRLQAVITGIAPEQGAMFNLDAKTWERRAVEVEIADAPEPE